MYLFFFAIGFGSANSVATGSRRLRESSATLGGLSSCLLPTPHLCTLSFDVLTYQVLSDPDWLPGMAEDILCPGMRAT